jgi:hypothetical protein
MYRKPTDKTCDRRYISENFPMPDFQGRENQGLLFFTQGLRKEPPAFVLFSSIGADIEVQAKLAGQAMNLLFTACQNSALQEVRASLKD